MKRIEIAWPINLAIAAALLLAAGCASSDTPAESEPSQQVMDTNFVNSINDSGISAAIVTQHTLYCYHFVENGRELNDLGRRDLAILATHFKAQGGGELSVRRGDVSETLYAARVHMVEDQLKNGGVDPGKVRIVDAAPAGEGISANDAIRALAKSTSAQPYQAADMRSNGTDTGVGTAPAPATPTGAGQ